jgi:hypothetical protein
MATLFLDFENGNDNYAGTSFALLAQGTDGRITSTTFSSATASFPNDGSLIGQYLSIFNGTIYAVYNITAWVSATSLTIAAISGGTALANQAVDRQYYIGGRWKNITTGATAVRTIPGDTIRMMGSPAPTSLGQNGVWTSQALQATKSITGATNATPIAITCTAHGYSTGDTVVVTSVAGNTNANGTWEITSTGANTFTLDGSAGNAAYTSGGTTRLRNNTRVKLATAVTQNIASTGPGRTAWTAGASVTATLSTASSKEHSNSDSIAIAAGFTTGLAAYWPLPSTLDLSGYQQVSFWILQTVGTVGAAGAIDLRLCSDAAGVTTVNTISIPNLAVINLRWMPVTVDLGTALGSSIQSIALYVNTDNGAQTFLLSNIIACKASSAADSLTLTSLIGKNTTGETFWGIQSINGTRVMLDADTNATPTSSTVRGYYGTSETVTTWKRETIKLGPAASSTTALQTIQESGTDGSPITYSGGWDGTNMSTQTLETWLDGQNGNGYGFLLTNISWTTVQKVAFVRFAAGHVSSGATGLIADIIAGNNCNTSTTRAAIFSNADKNCTFTIGHAVSNSTIGAAYILFSSNINLRIDHGALSNGGQGISFSQQFSGYTYKGSGIGLIANNGANGLLVNVGSASCRNLIFENNVTASVSQSSTFSDNNYFNNCMFSDTTEFGGLDGLGNASIYSQNHDQTAGNHRIVVHGGVIVSATDQRKTASGISWKMQPTSTTLRTASVPLVLSLAKVACSANNLVTIKAWMYRDNAGLTMRLVCKGGQLAGVASDVTASVTTTNTWEEETITFTPTETGVVEITAEAWGGTTFSGWVDDMTISQA